MEQLMSNIPLITHIITSWDNDSRGFSEQVVIRNMGLMIVDWNGIRVTTLEPGHWDTIFFKQFSSGSTMIFRMLTLLLQQNIKTTFSQVKLNRAKNTFDLPC